MGNLVRDRIPEIIAAEGRKPRVRVLSDEEFEAALLDKLLEEVTEFLEAEPENRLDEAADVYEVLLTLVAGQGFAADDLAVAADSKTLEAASPSACGGTGPDDREASLTGR